MVDIYEEDGAQYDMDSMGDVYRLWNKRKKEKKESNRAQSTKLLEDLNIEFDSYNYGVHLVVYGDEGDVVDFWPSTGKWIVRKMNKKGRGVFNMLKWLRRRDSPTRKETNEDS